MIFASRMDLREAFREEIRRLGVTKVEMTSDGDQAYEVMLEKPRMLLIADWELGRSAVVSVLDHLRKDSSLETRPVILVGKTLTDEVIAVGCEYSVHHIHTGEISRNKIRDIIENISESEEQEAPLRDVLSGFSDAKRSGRIESVIVAVEELRLKLPDNPRVAIELADLYIQQERWMDAISLLEPWEHRQPPYVRALHLLGRCFVKINKHDRASELYEKANVLNPFHVDRLVEIGKNFMRLQRYQEAKKSFQDAQALEPRHKEAVQGEGTCALVEGDVNEALGLLREAEQRELASVFNTSAVLSMRQGRYEHGMSLYETSMNLVSDDSSLKSRLMFNKGVGFQRWGKPSEAKKCFFEANTLDPTFAKASRQVPSTSKPTESPLEEIAEESLLAQPQNGTKPETVFGFGDDGDIDDLDDDFGF